MNAQAQGHHLNTDWVSEEWLSYRFSETTWNYLFLINGKEDAGQLRLNKQDAEGHLKASDALVQ